MRHAFASLLLCGVLLACGDDGQTTSQGSGGGASGPSGATSSTTSSASTSSTSTSSAAEATGSGGEGGTDGTGGEGGSGGTGGEGGWAGDATVVTFGPSRGIILDVDRLSSGDLVVCGEHDQNGFLARVTPDGQTVWSLESDVVGYGWFREVLVLDDDSIIIAGHDTTNTPGIEIARVSDDGEVLWSLDALSVNGIRDDAGRIARLGNDVAVNLGSDEIATLSIDGEVLRHVELDFGAVDRIEWAPGVSGAYLLGIRANDTAPENAYVARLDDAGDLVWQLHLDVEGRLPVGAVLPSGDLAVAMRMEDSRVFVARLDATGGVEWSRTIRLPDHFLTPLDVAASDDAIVVAGTVVDATKEEWSGMWTARLGPEGDLVSAATSSGIEGASSGLLGAAFLDDRLALVGRIGSSGVVVLDGDGTAAGCVDGSSPLPGAFDFVAIEVGTIDDAAVTITEVDTNLDARNFLTPAAVASSVVCGQP